MRALVTGGGGFLGTRIVQMLDARGDEVVALGRNRYPHHERAGLRTIQCDIRDAEGLGRAFEGIDTVFHAAALPGIWGKRSTFWEINVTGTEQVIAACRRCGVRRLVFTSSPSVVFGTDDLCGVDESQPYPARYLAHYPETKAEAEKLVLAASGSDLATVALRPHLIWGPGDPHLIPRVIERARAGRLVQVGDGTNLADITYVDNAAEAHLQAADELASDGVCAGRVYFISQGEPVRLWAWLNEILAAVDVPRVSRRVSYRAARRLGAAMEATYKLLRVPREPPMTRFLAAQLAKSHYFNITAAKRDFGYDPRISTSEGGRRLVAWLHGSQLDPSSAPTPSFQPGAMAQSPKGSVV